MAPKARSIREDALVHSVGPEQPAKVEAFSAPANPLPSFLWAKPLDANAEKARKTEVRKDERRNGDRLTYFAKPLYFKSPPHP